MKKLLSLALVVAMLASMLVVVPTAGATEAVATVEVTNAVGCVGDTVTVEAGDDNVIRIYSSSDRCCICGKIHEVAKLLQVPIGPNTHPFCISCARTICNTLKK